MFWHTNQIDIFDCVTLLGWVDFPIDQNRLGIIFRIKACKSYWLSVSIGFHNFLKFQLYMEVSQFHDFVKFGAIIHQVLMLLSNVKTLMKIAPNFCGLLKKAELGFTNSFFDTRKVGEKMRTYFLNNCMEFVSTSITEPII